MERTIVRAARVVDGVVEIQQDDETYAKASDALLISQGEADSTGHVILGEQFTLYFVNTQPDLELVIVKLTEICDQLITIGQNQYVIAADANVFGQPLIDVATEATTIKQYLEGFEPV